MNSRFLGYVVSSLFAFLFYVAWIFCDLSLSGRGAHEQFVGTLGGLIWFALFGGFGVVFLALILPWAVAVSVRPKARWSGRIYFTFVGAVLVFVLGCVISSLMPKPLFIEDQTFFEGVIIAASPPILNERNGLFSSVIILHKKGGSSMSNNVVAQIRTPTEDELKRMRDLWSALKQKALPASTETGIELQIYMAHAARMIGIIAGLHPVTGKPAIASKSPMAVSEDGVERLRDSAQLWSAILPLWTPVTAT